MQRPKSDRRPETVELMRKRILTGELLAGEPFLIDVEPALSTAQQADVVATLLGEGLVETGSGRPRVFIHDYTTLLDTFSILYSLGRSALQLATPTKITHDAVIDAQKELHQSLPNRCRGHDDGIEFLSTFAKAMSTLMVSLGLVESGRIIQRQLVRLNLLDPHAFNAAEGAHHLEKVYSVLGNELRSKSPNHAALRTLWETLVQHIAECWSLDALLRDNSSIFRHARLNLKKPNHGPRIKMR